MKRCPRCSARNSNSNSRCAKCGCKLPASSRSASAAPSARVLLPAAAIVLAVVIFLSVTTVFGLSPRNRVLSSAKLTLSALSDVAGDSDTLSTFRSVSEGLFISGNCQTTVHVRSDAFELQYEMNCAQILERMSGSLVYTDRTKGRAIPIEIYAGDKDVRLLAPSLTGEVYGFTFADLAKKKGISQKELAVYEPFSLSTSLESIAGESWDAFLKSVDAKKHRDDAALPGDPSRSCTVYKVSWDSKKAKELVSALSPDILLSLPANLFGWVTGSEPDCRCYVDADGYLIGIDWVSMGSKYTLCFLGADDLWSDLTLTVDPLIGSTSVYTGGVRAGDDSWELLLADSSGVFFGFVLDEQTGAFSLTAGGSALLRGTITATPGFAGVELVHGIGQTEELSASVSFGTPASKPEECTYSYTDLLHMNANELQRLLIEVTG